MTDTQICREAERYLASKADNLRDYHTNGQKLGEVE